MITASKPMPSVKAMSSPSTPGAFAATARSQPPARRALHGCRGDVGACHAAARRLQQLHGDPPDESEADHQHALAVADPALADAVHGHAADRRVRRVLEGDLLGHLRAEQLRHAYVSRVHRRLGTGARHPVADAERGDAGRDALDHAGAGVAERRPGVEAVAHGLHGGGDALGLHLRQHLRHEVGPRLRLAHEALAPQVHLGLLGACREQRRFHAHEHAARL